MARESLVNPENDTRIKKEMEDFKNEWNISVFFLQIKIFDLLEVTRVRDRFKGWAKIGPIKIWFVGTRWVESVIDWSDLSVK